MTDNSKKIIRTFLTSEKGYFVISPIARLSPVLLATPSPKDLKIAKIIYYANFFAILVFLVWWRSHFQNVSHPLKWPSLLGATIGVHVVIYVLILAFAKEIQIFDRDKHGDIID